MGVAKAHPDPWVFEEETREQETSEGMSRSMRMGEENRKQSMQKLDIFLHLHCQV